MNILHRAVAFEALHDSADRFPDVDLTPTVSAAGLETLDQLYSQILAHSDSWACSSSGSSGTRRSPPPYSPLSSLQKGDPRPGNPNRAGRLQSPAALLGFKSVRHLKDLDEVRARKSPETLPLCISDPEPRHGYEAEERADVVRISSRFFCLRSGACFRLSFPSRLAYIASSLYN